MTRLAPIFLAALAVLGIAGSEHVVDVARAETTEVVVLLESPPLAEAPDSGAALGVEQQSFRRALTDNLPDAQVGWQYRLVANGFSISVPSSQMSRLRALPGVREVLPAATYGPQLDRTPQQIGAPVLWGPELDTAGQGVKIGIIDSGVDASHPFFDPAGYTMPPGFPKGQVKYTTTKVIVARAFAPRGAAPSARAAVHPSDISHGTHVAGVAAGNAHTQAGGRVVSGVAPRAYIGNYKVFVEAESGVASHNANSPAIVAAIEAAVADGMDVINFSGGEPEIEPSRDIVARALDAAAAAGVVPVVAAGNDFNDAGAGSVSSPANSARALAVGAVEITGSPVRREHADFSSVGPTTMSLQLKPDVTAPGVDVLSSVPGGWASFSGTSMAAPHIAGAAALLAERHPEWTVAQIKSALVQSGNDVVDKGSRILGPQFQGGGVVALARADKPLLFADPTALSFGLLGRQSTLTGSIRLDDAGGGSGDWQVVGTRSPGSTAEAALVLPTSVGVPGTLSYEVVVPASARLGDLTGFIELRRGADLRRIPFWGRVRTAALQRHTVLRLLRPGNYRSSTVGRPAFVTRYRYPENPSGIGVSTVLRGPERVFRIMLTKRVANFGVVVTHHGPGSRVEPRVVAQLDENRLTGFAGLPVAYNPYLEEFRSSVPVAGALSPVPGEYAVVFDSATRAGAGSFTFRYWIDDVTPPTLRVHSRSVDFDRPVQVAARDSGSGVYPDSVVATIDGVHVPDSFRGGVVSISTSGFAPGTHRLRLRVSDYQESKNTENVAKILANTRRLTATITIR
ncbi:MAG: S8 family serine peptidase [Gaiellaceae bacterium]